MSIRQWLMRHRFWQDQSGQGLVEYALILIFVAVVLIALLVILGPGITNIYENIIENIQGIG
jgi:pilus assembly protein Flp/PilA